MQRMLLFEILLDTVKIKVINFPSGSKFGLKNIFQRTKIVYKTETERSCTFFAGRK